MAPTLPAIFPDPKTLLTLEPEELAGVLVEIIPDISQSAGFMIDGIMAQMFPPPPNSGYDLGYRQQIELAVAEALSWLETQGVIVRNPGQPAAWYKFTRRGQALKTRADLTAFRKGRLLPIDLLQPSLASKVHHLFLRGDHDIAVFQAFKEVEVAVRKAGSFPDRLVGAKLMSTAFHPENGVLRDASVDDPNERAAEMQLFSSAMGHARNPAGHRDGVFTGIEASRLIVFSSYLLDIVERRSLALTTP